MNRNVMYDYLKSVGLKALFLWDDGNKRYHTEFRLQPHQSNCDAIFSWGYIRHIFSIHLCANEIVVEGEYGRMKVNVFYRDIDEEKFEVRIEEE